MQVENQAEDKLTDRYLVEQVLRGNMRAFNVIVKNTEGLVAQIVFKMIPNYQDRKDIAQDVYLKAFKNLKGFRFQSKVSTWIAQISYCTCLNFLERKKLLLVENIEDQEDINVVINQEAEGFIFKKELRNILQNAIEQLSPIYKTLITLYHQEELSYEEITQITDLPEGTVKSYLFRARKVLKDSLLNQYKKDEL